MHVESRNRFLRHLLVNCRKTRPSRRHPGYMRVSVRDYRQALLSFIQQSAADLMEAMNMQSVVDDLADRCDSPQLQAGSRLIQDILGDAGKAPIDIEAPSFNRMAEGLYRGALRERQLREAMRHLKEDLVCFDRSADSDDRGQLRHGVRVQNVERFVQDVADRVAREELSLHEIEALLNLILLFIARDRRTSAETLP